MKSERPKPDKRNEIERRWLKREINDGLRDAYLGPCPECGGNVFGSLVEPRCRDCGWSNTVLNSKQKRGAA